MRGLATIPFRTDAAGAPAAPRRDGPQQDGPDDDALLSSILAGDQDAFLQLYRRYSPRVYPLVSRIAPDAHTADEILQDVFYKLWTKAALYDSGQGSFIAWLMTLARNVALDRIRNESRRARYFVSLGTESTPSRAEERLSTTGVVVDAAGENRAHETGMESRILVRRALDTLPEAQRQALELSYFGGFTAVEIAEVSGEPVGTIKTRLRLGLKKLRECIG